MVALIMSTCCCAPSVVQAHANSTPVCRKSFRHPGWPQHPHSLYATCTTVAARQYSILQEQPYQSYHEEASMHHSLSANATIRKGTAMVLTYTARTWQRLPTYPSVKCICLCLLSLSILQYRDLGTQPCLFAHRDRPPR